MIQRSVYCAFLFVLVTLSGALGGTYYSLLQHREFIQEQKGAIKVFEEDRALVSILKETVSTQSRHLKADETTLQSYERSIVLLKEQMELLKQTIKLQEETIANQQKIIDIQAKALKKD